MLFGARFEFNLGVMFGPIGGHFGRELFQTRPFQDSLLHALMRSPGKLFWTHLGLHLGAILGPLGCHFGVIFDSRASGLVLVIC